MQYTTHSTVSQQSIASHDIAPARSFYFYTNIPATVRHAALILATFNTVFNTVCEYHMYVNAYT